MTTTNQEKSGSIHVNIPQDNSFLSVEGQKKLFNYRMRFMWPFLLLSLLVLLYSFWNIYNVQKVQKQREERSLQTSEVTAKYNAFSDKCRYITLSQYKDINSPEAQMLMAKCITDELNYERSLGR